MVLNVMLCNIRDLIVTSTIIKWQKCDPLDISWHLLTLITLRFVTWWMAVLTQNACPKEAYVGSILLDKVFASSSKPKQFLFLPKDEKNKKYSLFPQELGFVKISHLNFSNLKFRVRVRMQIRISKRHLSVWQMLQNKGRFVLKPLF